MLPTDVLADSSIAARNAIRGASIGQICQTRHVWHGKPTVLPSQRWYPPSHSPGPDVPTYVCTVPEIEENRRDKELTRLDSIELFCCVAYIVLLLGLYDGMTMRNKE